MQAIAYRFPVDDESGCVWVHDGSDAMCGRHRPGPASCKQLVPIAGEGAFFLLLTERFSGAAFRRCFGWKREGVASIIAGCMRALASARGTEHAHRLSAQGLASTEAARRGDKAGHAFRVGVARVPRAGGTRVV